MATCQRESLTAGLAMARSVRALLDWLHSSLDDVILTSLVGNDVNKRHQPVTSDDFAMTWQWHHYVEMTSWQHATEMTSLVTSSGPIEVARGARAAAHGGTCHMSILNSKSHVIVIWSWSFSRSRMLFGCHRSITSRHARAHDSCSHLRISKV